MPRPEPVWTNAITRTELVGKGGKTVIKLNGKQILLWLSEGTVYACNNRCPHEGYPLSEGTLADACVLTCNWHNWKFDLESGETLVGGDKLRVFPVRLEDDLIILDLADPPAQDVRDEAIAGLRQAFDEHDYERMARELARYQQTGADPVDVLPIAFEWAADGFEFGMTHAQAGAPDWLALRDRIAASEPEARLIPLIEIIGHLSWDRMMQKGPFPFRTKQASVFDAAALENAIEREDQDEAIAQIDIALETVGADTLRPPLERAALRHYQNFGHTPIYLEKTYELIEILGDAAARALFYPLVRTLCTGAREDLIPEFRGYASALEKWDPTATDLPQPDDLRGKGVNACFDMVTRAGGNAGELFDVLMHAGCDAMLHFDPQYREHVDKPVQQNVDWLDFTHTMTHLNASRRICERQPDLWANSFLQTACFLGRNTNFIDWEQDVAQWTVDKPDTFLDEVFDGLLDHGQPLYIYSVHVLKLATAIKEELERNPHATWKPVAFAALNRLLHEPAKQKHMLRVTKQAFKFVEAQG